MTTGPTDKPAARPRAMTADERRQVAEVLGMEYGLLTGALGAVWSASLVRTSIFLAVISASGVALGFAAQSGLGTLTTFAIVIVPLALLPVASFAATVVVLLGYWSRSLAGLRAAIRPISPTPPEEIEGPI